MPWISIPLPCCGLGHRVGDGPVPQLSSTGAVTIAADLTSGVNLTENHRFEFHHFPGNVDLKRIGGGVCSFLCPHQTCRH